MRVIVLGTGRCGTTTFTQACKHITNYTSSHEKHWFDIPDRHIEANPYLTWHVGCWLPKAYPDHRNLKFVELVRNKDDVVNSWARRGEGHGAGVFKKLTMPKHNMKHSSSVCYDTMRALIQHHIVESTASWGFMRLQLETIQTQWQGFWRWIEAEGDFDASLLEWGKKYNAS